MIIVNGFLALTIVTKRSILDVVAVLDPPLHSDLFVFSKLNVTCNYKKSLIFNGRLRQTI